MFEFTVHERTPNYSCGHIFFDPRSAGGTLDTMSYRSSSSTLVDNLVHWSIPASSDDDLEEEETSIFSDVLELGDDKGNGKGKAKESMYVSLCEGA